MLVDEYQDTNRLQSSILLALKPGGRGLTVVGDDAQSIYSFRAATVRNILDFPDQFAPRAEIITLDRNYRSTQPILVAANGVIDLARERFTKNLWTERASEAKPRLVAVRDEADQARYIVERVLANREEGSLLKQQAVLFRTSSHSGPLEIELTRRNIPFVKFGGLKFLDSAHIKDMLALLRFVENPRDRVAGFRILHLLPGIGPASAQRVLDHMAEAADPIEALCRLPSPPRSGEDWKDFVRTIGNLRYGEWPADIERARLWYEPHLDRIHEDAETRRADLIQLEQIANGYRFARTLPHRAHARSAGRHQRPGRRAAAGRRLPDPVDDPFRQRPGMEIRLRAERRRRLHAVGSRRRHLSRARRGAPPALCGDDSRQGRPASRRAAALLHPRPARARRPSRLRLAHALHPAGAAAAVRANQLADVCTG